MWFEIQMACVWAESEAPSPALPRKRERGLHLTA
jgi:hypothetical protein